MFLLMAKIGKKKELLQANVMNWCQFDNDISNFSLLPANVITIFGTHYLKILPLKKTMKYKPKTTLSWKKQLRPDLEFLSAHEKFYSHWQLIKLNPAITVKTCILLKHCMICDKHVNNVFLTLKKKYTI